MKKDFEICGRTIPPNCRLSFLYEFANLYTKRPLKIPFEVINGQGQGPTIFIFSCVHGNELNGIEIINRLRQHDALEKINGTIIMIPVVNPFGLILRTRGLINDKDLNRMFPGKKNGSLASRLAYFLNEEIINKSDFGIDLHSGSDYLYNTPHLRISKTQNHLKELALSFGVPVLQSKVFPNSLREHAEKKNLPLLTFEAGEANRIDAECIEFGIQGLLNTLSYLKIIKDQWSIKNNNKIFCDKSHWVRAPSSGILFLSKDTNTFVKKDAELAEILDPFMMKKKVKVIAPKDGLLLSKSTSPLVNEGDPLFRLAEPSR